MHFPLPCTLLFKLTNTDKSSQKVYDKPRIRYKWTEEKSTIFYDKFVDLLIRASTSIYDSIENNITKSAHILTNVYKNSAEWMRVKVSLPHFEKKFSAVWWDHECERAKSEKLADLRQFD